MQISGMANIQHAEIDSQNNILQGQLFSSFSNGDTLEAEVVSVSGQEVTLKMPNGTDVKAVFPEGVVVREGDMIELTVSSKDVSPIHLKLSAVNGQTVNLESNELQVFLMNMGVQPSRVNQSAANLFIKYHINPTPERMAALLEIAAAMPDLPESLAVFMAANNIPATSENVQILTEWTAHSSDLGNSINELIEILGGEITKNGFPEYFQQNLLKEGNANIQEVFTGERYQALLAELADPTMEVSNAKILIRGYLADASVSPKEKQYLEILMINSFLEAKKAAAGQESVGGQKEGIPGSIIESNASERSSIQNTGGPNPEVSPNMPKEPLAAEAHLAAALTMGAESTEKGNSGMDTLIQTLNRFFASVNNAALSDDAANIQDAVKNQTALAGTIKENVAKVLGESAPATQKAETIAAQTQIAGRMEQFYYCQIPFENRGQKNTAELYVLKRKPGQKYEDKGKVTILVGLDTEHMGRVETVLHSDEDKLSVEFRVENNKIKRLFMDSIQDFKQMMRENEFDMEHITVRMIENPVTPLNVMEQLGSGNGTTAIAGIDIQI